MNPSWLSAIAGTLALAATIIFLLMTLHNILLFILFVYRDEIDP